MCKLFIATGRFTSKQALDMLRRINKAFAYTQRDGFGFMAYGPDGVAYGRYLDPSSYSEFGLELPKFIKSTQVERGEMPELVTAIVAHGRTSTNKVNLHNCHPFSKSDVYLAHNGVVDWKGHPSEEPEAKHDCDTEQYFNWIMSRRRKGGIRAAFNKTDDHWTGYGVFGVVDTVAASLTVAKCGMGRLNWVGNSEAHIFSTEAQDAESAASIIGVGSSAVPVSGNTIITYDVRRGLSMAAAEKWCGFSRAETKDWRYRRSYGSDYSPAATNGLVQGSASTPTAVQGSACSIGQSRELFPDWEPKGRGVSEDDLVAAAEDWIAKRDIESSHPLVD